MSPVERIVGYILLVLSLVLFVAMGVQQYGAAKHEAGYQAAVEAGKAQHDRDAAAALKTESDLRAQLRIKDTDAYQKEQDHAASLQAAQRRVRAGTDRLLCPGPVPAGSAPDHRPAAGGPGAEGEGSAIVPEAAADLLGIGADIAGIVRRYERVVERFEACRAVNAGP